MKEKLLYDSLCTTLRHRHSWRGRLIEIAEVEEKKEACEANEYAIRREGRFFSRMLLVPLHLCPEERQQFSRTCPSVRQALEKVGK